MIARYLVPHAAVVLGMIDGGTTADRDARQVLAWITRHGRGTFSRRDVHQAVRRRFENPNDLDPILVELTRAVTGRIKVSSQ